MLAYSYDTVAKANRWITAGTIKRMSHKRNILFHSFWRCVRELRCDHETTIRHTEINPLWQEKLKWFSNNSVTSSDPELRRQALLLLNSLSSRIGGYTVECRQRHRSQTGWVCAHPFLSAVGKMRTGGALHPVTIAGVLRRKLLLYRPLGMNTHSLAG